MMIKIHNDPLPNSPHRIILDRIPSGRDNAVSMTYLASILHTDTRQIRHMIELARTDGNIIAGTNDGLFIPETNDELHDYISRTYSHIKTTIMTLNPALQIYGKRLYLIVEGENHD